jgi:pimeloyl-ACP methyl ester carboxylesterase
MSPAELHAMGDVERANWDPADRAHWAEMKSLFNLDVVEKTGDWGRTPWRETAAKITCPVLLITADPERGAIVTPESAEEAMGLLRSGKTVRIANAGHNVRRDNYGPYRDAVVGFLAEVTG